MLARRSRLRERRWKDAVLHCACFGDASASPPERVPLANFTGSFLERIFPERQDQQEDQNLLGNAFCCPYQFPCATRREVPAVFLCLLPMVGELKNKLPLTICYHVQLETASAWDLSKQLQALKGENCCPVALTTHSSLPAETSTTESADPSPGEISCALTSELPVIHHRNHRLKVNRK